MSKNNRSSEKKIVTRRLAWSEIIDLIESIQQSELDEDTFSLPLSDSTKKTRISIGNQLQQQGEHSGHLSSKENKKEEGSETLEKQENSTKKEPDLQEGNINKSNETFRVKACFKAEFKALAKTMRYDLSSDISNSFNAQKIHKTIKDQMASLGTNSGDIQFSGDNRFVLKRIPSGQHKVFRDNIGLVCLNNIYNTQDSLSLKILGAYEIESIHGSESASLIGSLNTNYYVLMQNVLDDWDFENVALNSVYDLKGSNFGRSQDNSSSSSSSSGSDEETANHPRKDNKNQNGKTSAQEHPSNGIQQIFGKDNDLKKNIDDLKVLRSLDETVKLQLISHLDEEAKLYEKANIMDYSLIVIIGKELGTKPSQDEQNNQINSQLVGKNKFRNIKISGNRVLSFGLIDYLSTYDLGRLIENKFKSFFCARGEEISCVDPSAYQQRFIKYLREQIFAE